MIENGEPESGIPKENLTSRLQSVTRGLFHHNNNFYLQIDGFSRNNTLASTIVIFSLEH